MIIEQLKKTTVALFSVLTLSIFASGLAFAQDQDEEKEEAKEAAKQEVKEEGQAPEEYDTVLEEVIVTTYRASVERSLELKRDSDTIIDAVSAEDVGKFPDQTVADALQRLPGIQVERSEGVSDRISIRGTAPHLNLTLLNGQNVATATASTSILKSSRGFNYSLLPTEIVRTLEVHKSSEAKLDEGSIGGTVIVRTRKPLDTDSGYLALSAKTLYQPSSGEHSPQVSGFYSWKNENSNFGFNLGYVMKDSFLRSDRWLVNGWGPVTLNGQELYTPDQTRASRYESNKDLQTITAGIGFDIGDNLSVNFSNMFSEIDHANQVTTMGAYGAGSRSQVYPVDIVGDTVVSGTIAGDPGDGNWAKEGYYSFNNHKGGYETRVHDIEIEYTQDSWSLSTQFGITEADGEILDDQVEFQSTAEIWFDIGDEDLLYHFNSGSEADGFTGLYNHRNHIFNDQDETYFQTDLNIVFDNDFIYDLDVGFKYRDHEKSSGLYKTVWHPLDLRAQILSDFTDGSLVGDFMNDGFSPQAMYEFDYGSWAQWMADTPILREYEHYDYSFKLQEESTAGYVQANFSGEKLRGNVGVRYVKTDQTSDGYEYSRQVSWNPNAWILHPVTVKRDYSDVLPSLNLNYYLNEDTIFRFAAAKVMARPDYDLLSSRRGYRKSPWSNPKNPGFQGNPYLDPYRANQYDLSAEYYFSSGSVASIAYFYKDIESYIDTEYEVQLLPDDQGNIDEYNISKPVNMEGGVNQGIEVNFQHYFDFGMGLQANYTYSTADMDEPGAELPNHSEHTYNATVYYETDDYSARLSYNYRDKYYRGRRGTLNWYQDAYGQLDANFTYFFKDNYTVMLQVLNIADENQTSNLGQDRLYNNSYFGRRIYLGISAKF